MKYQTERQIGIEFMKGKLISMKFQTIVLEGDKNTEKKYNAENFPVNTKSAYLHRKWMERRLPLYNRSFYLCRTFVILDRFNNEVFHISIPTLPR